MKIIATISRILVGLLFIFSGYVKAVDPLGSTYKFVDYFYDAFHLPALEPFAFPLAIIMSALELTIGLILVFNVLPKLAAWGALLLMLFFTPLTLFLAITDAVKDCGCFGDAIKLTNWQTFWKNIIILIPVLVVFVRRKHFENEVNKIIQFSFALFFVFISFGFERYNYNHLPVIDFMPYKVGTYIPNSMIIPKNAPQDSFAVSLVYKNIASGEQKEFSMENYPQDTTWEWVETKTTLIKEGYKPPIHDFTITNSGGFEITEDILNESEPVFLFVAYNLNKTKIEGFENVKEIWQYAKDKKYTFYTLTASSEDQIKDIVQQIGYKMEFCNTDETTLKTIIRSNPGLVVLRKGKVVGKWHFNDIPTIEKLEKTINKNTLFLYYKNFNFIK